MTQTRTAFIAIVGCPNVGKSSILNRLLGQKVAVVSPKPQTTRTKIMGVLTEDEVQLVFTDTPGFHRPRTKLGEKMIKAVSDSISGVDACLFVVEPSGELRTSNFLLWQSAYAEYYFTDMLWPDFDEAELDRAIASYRTRERRFGGRK